MKGRHANRQGAALTVTGLLGRVRAELRAERRQLDAERAVIQGQREAMPVYGRHARQSPAAVPYGRHTWQPPPCVS